MKALMEPAAVAKGQPRKTSPTTAEKPQLSVDQKLSALSAKWKAR
jgi:hypothetical protein